MKKVVVGILPTYNKGILKNPYDDSYKFIELYSNKVKLSGGIPLGILPDKDNLNLDILDLCDAFIIPGGTKIEKYAYELIIYAIKKNKPLLGICLGSQSIAITSLLLEHIDINKDITIEEITTIYNKLKEENEGSLLKKVPEPNIHGNIVISEDTIDEARHIIKIEKDSLLYKIYNKEELSVVSLHNYDYKKVGSSFKVTAKSTDNVNEAVEYKKENTFILGVEFHPELEENNLIFESLIKAAKRLGDK